MLLPSVICILLQASSDSGLESEWSEEFIIKTLDEGDEMSHFTDTIKGLKSLTILTLPAVLYCTLLYCIALYYTVLYCTVMYCTVLYCTLILTTLYYRETD